LMEYRLDEREWRLFLAALIFGAGMADNCAMIGFFPIFIAAIIWIRCLSFFNLQFLGRMTILGLIGMSLYLFLPLVAVISGKTPVTFWQAFKVNLSGEFAVIKAFFL